MKVIVGEPWTEPLAEVTDRAESRKSDVNIMFAVVFLILLVAHTANAMVTHDHPILKESMTVVEIGLACVAAWAGGRATLKVLSRFHDEE